ncbi:MAG TPA: amino acid adenylation domain-containing protein [Candidatus Binatia bacterium]|nr:amino acid adenylation domain-containing protein [Candidatus Binatia bacterium]
MSRAGLKTSPAHDPFAGPSLAAYVPATASQAEIWLSAALAPEANAAYNEGTVWTLRGPLDLPALQSAVQRLVDRHESLRACFSADGRSMLIHQTVAVDLPLRELARDDLDAVQRRLTAQPLDLERGPLFRFELYRAGPDLHYLLAVAHHAICDGRSWGRLVGELGALYSDETGAGAAPLPRPESYLEYARREREFLASGEAHANLRYWVEQLRDAPPPVSLPPDGAAPAQRSYAAGRYDHALPPELCARLRRFAAASNSSLVMTLLAAFAAQVHRLTGSGDLVIGLAASGQVLHGLPQVVGHCVNFMPLRLRPAGADTLAQFLAQTRSVVLDAIEHQGITFGTLVPQLHLDRSDDRPPLISVAFNLDQREDCTGYAGLEVQTSRIHRAFENFELFVNLVDDGEALSIECSYNAALFGADSMRRRMQEYETVLGSLEQALQRPLADLPLLADAERQRLSSSPGTQAAIPDGTIHGLIARQAAARPDAIAVECGGQALSYAQLLARADAIGAALRARGVAPGDFVGVCLVRSPDLPAALLGVLKCGAAYVPLDPELPARRLRFMLDDAKARLLLCQAATASAVAGASLQQRLALEDVAAATGPVDVAVDPGAPAYAIYTSGSTGAPKGVVAHHRGVINCMAGTCARIPVGPDDALLAIATYAFDASVLEYFLPLMHGAQLVLATSEEAADGRLLAQLIERHGITRIFTAPAAWRLLLAASWAGKPDLVGVSWAEPLTPDLARDLLPRLGQLWNLYGPTEATVWMLGCRVTDADAPITIGTPIPNTCAYILDPQRRPVPVGVAGELYIGGAGVALGYLNQPQLTAERFLDDPSGSGRMYRTGDLARWTAQGEVACLGRADHQVKLRGFRIELGEIESVLRSCAGVADSACDLRERSAGDPRLVAWVQPRAGADLSASELRQQLRAQLPAYMVPQHFVVLEALPRLPNGKLDRQRLADPFAARPAQEPERTAPRSEAERKVAAVWREVLGHEHFGVDDRFLDRGGHSLLAVQVGEQLREVFGLRLPLRVVLTGTLAQLAQACAQGTAGAGEGGPAAAPALARVAPGHS